ncbi:hypothetical protein FQR65_LT16613 [Abscondita terminalis]|nr:hypothetical protein FQR65_LT16613 [Abscondita terminalis]
MKFIELIKNPKVLLSLEKIGFSEATDIQVKTIPLLLKNKNIFGKSSTGTGKTAAFSLPILEKINVKLRKPQAMIIAPTRELAEQIIESIRKFSLCYDGIKITGLIGGKDMRRQILTVQDSQIIVGTPGRIDDHIKRKSLKLHEIKTLVLDEADEMLKMGFKNEIDNICSKLVEEVQMVLFSATSNTKVMEIANNYMKEYETVEINNIFKINDNIENDFIITKGIKKEDLLMKIIEVLQPKKTVIFSNTKSYTEKIFFLLKDNKIKSSFINGDKRQSERTRAINGFKNSEYKFLIATDVAARGIDIKDIDLVINYDVPRDNEYFVHRIGRTGRNGSKGRTISFVENKGTLRQINEVIKEFEIDINELDPIIFGLQKSEIFLTDDKKPRRKRSSGNRNHSFGDSKKSQSSNSNFSDKKNESHKSAMFTLIFTLMSNHGDPYSDIPDDDYKVEYYNKLISDNEIMGFAKE